ncbi:MAG: SUMF1/EgtB/PvdO family nonheme iron enzyme [Cyclobacteriaceae bacterium]
MKRVIILFVLFPLSGWALAPERVLPKTLVIKPVSWYAEQRKAWAEAIAQRPADPAAWLNYYAASVFAHEATGSLQQIVSEMGKAVPNSYEYWVAKGWSAGFTAEAREALQTAYRLKPEQSEAYGLLQLISEFDLNKSDRGLFSKGLYEKSQVSASLLNYSYNVLMSLEPSAVLITEGESTTIPLFVLQDVLNIRQDVTILDLDLLTHQWYATRKFQETGIVQAVRASSFSEDVRAWICSQLPDSNPNRKFYYALTLAKDNITSIKEYLYVVGLASLHSLTNVDNVSQIKRNLEKEFLMDYLLVDFSGESEHDAGRVFSANYLVPMILAYEAYVKEGKTQEADKLRGLMEKIARETGKSSIMANFLYGTNTESIPYYPLAINAKSWEEEMRPLTSTTYAARTEVTNAQYNRFLEYLTANNLSDLYENYKFDFSDYEEPALSMMINYSTPRVETKKNKFFNHYPAVNVRYEAAVAYCEWMTQQYNQAADRKFKKVKFRLPTVDEWQIAAAGIKNPTSWKLNEQMAEVRITPKGAEMDKNAEKRMVSLSEPEILYPWFRYYGLRNSALNTKGCYLGNFKASPCNCPGYRGSKPNSYDGFTTMGPVMSYFANDVGLFDVVGNVAEMVNEKGSACGGSWNHSPDESTIRSIHRYDKPDASIGFRVFMEIVEN